MEIKPTRIVWHHTADKADGPQFDKVNKYHKQRDFPLSSMGFYVGYHYLIEQNGTIKQARKETEIGAHDTGENLNSIGVCIAGDFTKSQPTAAQAASAARLVREIRNRWRIPLTRIEPHRWDDDTECPGRALADNWLVSQYLQREGSIAEKIFLAIGKAYNLI